MKKYFKKFKEIWSNKRYKALITLGLYFIFFVFVFYIIGNSSDEPKLVDSYDILKKSNYKYTINEEIFVGDNITYQNEIYNKDDFKEYNFNITIDNIIYLIKNGILESQNYIDNSYTYIVEGEKYNELLTNKINSDQDIHIKVYKENDTITRIIIDFSLFYGYDYIMDLEVL